MRISLPEGIEIGFRPRIGAELRVTLILVPELEKGRDSMFRIVAAGT